MNFLTGYFSEELEDERPRMRSSLANSSDDYRAQVRDGLAELIASRSMSTDEFWRVTWKSFDDEDQMYRELTEAYRFLFGADPADRKSGAEGDQA